MSRAVTLAIRLTRRSGSSQWCRRLDLVDATITGSITLQQLLTNEWIWLVARPEGKTPWQCRTTSGWVTHSTDSNGTVALGRSG